MPFVCCVNCSLYEGTQTHVISAHLAVKIPETLSLVFSRGLKQSLLITQRYENYLPKRKILCLTFLLATLVNIESCWCQLHFVWLNGDNNQAPWLLIKFAITLVSCSNPLNGTMW